LAEGEPELAVPDVPRKATRHAPAGSRSGARGRGPRGAREPEPRNLEEAEEDGGGRDRESASPAPACRRRPVLHRQQATQFSLPKAQVTVSPVWGVPRVPVASRATVVARDAVCAVPYSQRSPEPPTASSTHCARSGAEGSIPQKEVTVMFAVSFRPMSSAFGALCNSANVHACVHTKNEAQARSAEGSPIFIEVFSGLLYVKRPKVWVREPLTSGGAGAGQLVVVVLVVVVVVVLVVFVTTATRSVTQVSARPRTVSESPGNRQSFGCFASSFAKQPLVISVPPVYFAVALSTQPPAFGLGSFPGVSAVEWHLRTETRYFATHFFLPTPHFVCIVGAGSMAPRSDVTQSSTAVSAGSVASPGLQSLFVLFSSFPKQPLVGSGMPWNLPSTFGTQLGSAALPGVSAISSHLSSPAAFVAMHFTLPARHFAC